MNVIGCILLGYLVGGINPAYLVGKRKGFDIRHRGSGNAGASNALIVMGKKAAIFSALFDIFKAFLVASFAAQLFRKMVYSKILAGVACIIGHIFPVFMNFRGGKGLACFGGVILAYNWRLFVVMLLAELLLVLLVDYICIVPITASLAFSFIYAVHTEDNVGTLLLLGCAAVIFFKHVENIRRIRNGTEAHFSFLWKREEEIERLMGDTEEQTESK